MVTLPDLQLCQQILFCGENFKNSMKLGLKTTSAKFAEDWTKFVACSILNLSIKCNMAVAKIKLIKS